MLKMFSIYRGISKDAKLLVYQSILPSVAYGLFFTDISYFLTTVQGLSYGFMGIVITTMGIATFAASIPLGLVADRYGRKKMLIMGNVVSGGTLVVFAFTTDPVFVNAQRFLKAFLKLLFLLPAVHGLQKNAITQKETASSASRDLPKAYLSESAAWQFPE